MYTKTRGLIILRCLHALLFCACAGSQAQSYPMKPVRYVVAFSAGDSPDIVVRLVGERLARLWNQQVLVLQAPDLQQRLADLVIETAPTSRDEFTAFIRSELERWGKVVKEARIPLQ
jgi:tripartite-type tricarboxylate transporter receptor subunit TctC